MEAIGPGARPYRDFEYPRLLEESPCEGAWAASPATFHVEEIPLYPFVGAGEHAALVIEKVGVTTRDVVTRVVAALKVSPAAVGYAGMKDKASTSVQAFTVTGVDEVAAAEAFGAAGCHVLSATRHRNKLRLGHLAGNRFTVRVSGADPGALRQRVLSLVPSGVPNYYGPQRFGAEGSNALQGLRVLQGRAKVGRWKRDLLVSALQAFVFNAVLARRLAAGRFGTVLEGDVLRREDSGGMFVCEDAAIEQPRLDAFEISPTGPIHGRKMVRPAAATAEVESQVLKALELDEALFDRETGTRRPLRVRLEQPSVAPDPEGAVLSFTLPAGSFATSVLREVIGG